MITSLYIIAALHGPFFGGPFTTGLLPERINEASGMVASFDGQILWLVNDSGGDPSVYGIREDGSLVTELRLRGATNTDWEDLAYHPATRTIYVADIGDNAARRSSIRLYTVQEPATLQGQVMDVTPTVRDLVYPDGPRDAETLLCDPRTGTLYIVSKRERRNRLYEVPQHGDTLRFVTDLPFYLATGGDVAADGSSVLVKNYQYVYHWDRRDDESVAEAMRRTPQRVHYMPEVQGESICFAHDDTGYYVVTEREDGGPLAPIEFYPTVPTEQDVQGLRDVRRPSLMLIPVDGAADRYTIRYALTEETNIELVVRNALGMTVMTIEDDSREAGAQERDLDLSKVPDGTYVVVLRTRSTYASAAIDVKR